MSWNELGSILAYSTFWKFVKKWLFFFLKFLVEFAREVSGPGVFIERNFLFVESVVMCSIHA